MYVARLRSSVDGRLGCFRVLAVVNGAAVSAEVCVSVWIVVFSGMCPVLGLLGHGTGLF